MVRRSGSTLSRQSNKTSSQNSRRGSSQRSGASTRNSTQNRRSTANGNREDWRWGNERYDDFSGNRSRNRQGQFTQEDRDEALRSGRLYRGYDDVNEDIDDENVFYSGRGRNRRDENRDFGRIGTEYRWSRDFDEDDENTGRGRSNRYNDDTRGYRSSYEIDFDEEDDVFGRRAGRSEAGRRGAEARWGTATPSRSTARTTSTRRNVTGTGRSSTSRSEAGRRGAEARWGTATPSRSTARTSALVRSGSSNKSVSRNKSISATNSRRKSMSRSEAGRKGAEARWGRR